LIGNGVKDSGMEGEDVYNSKREESVLASLSELYSKLDAISIGVSGLSSYLISHHLLTISTTNYCPKKNVNDFVLKRIFYTRCTLRAITILLYGQIIIEHYSMELLCEKYYLPCLHKIICLQSTSSFNAI